MYQGAFFDVNSILHEYVYHDGAMMILYHGTVTVPFCESKR